MDARLTQAFVERLPAAVRAEAEADPSLPGLLREARERGRRAHPTVAGDDTRFAAQLALAHRSGEALGDSMRETRVEDLFLAAACAAGDAAAIDTFERDHAPTLRRVARKFASTALADDDAAQLIREKLLVGPAPRIATYAGRGSLRSWLRTVATRTLVDHLRAHQRLEEALVDEWEDIARSLGHGDSLARRIDAGHLKRALERALGSLDARSRNLLRLHLLEALGIDAIAARYDVHRATAARWVAAAKEQVSKSVHQGIARDLGLTACETDDLARLVHSQLEQSLHRILVGGLAET